MVSIVLCCLLCVLLVCVVRDLMFVGCWLLRAVCVFDACCVFVLLVVCCW